MRRAPRPYVPAVVSCAQCGERVRMDAHAYYVHVRRQPIKGGHIVREVTARFRDE